MALIGFCAAFLLLCVISIKHFGLHRCQLSTYAQQYKNSKILKLADSVVPIHKFAVVQSQHDTENIIWIDSVS